MTKEPQPHQSSKNNSLLFGIFFSILLFLVIPLTQIFNDYKRPPDSINAYEISPPPPPPPPEDPPPPPEEDEPPPELDTPPPPLTLEQLEMVLDPGTGGALTGDVALPSLDTRRMNMIEIIDVSQLDNFPGYRTPPSISYPYEARTREMEGSVKVSFRVDEDGNVFDVIVEKHNDPENIFRPVVIDAYRKAKFNPGTRNGKPVKFKMAQNVPFVINN